MHWLFFAVVAMVGVNGYSAAAKSLTGFSPALANAFFCFFVGLSAAAYFLVRHFAVGESFHMPSTTKEWLLVVAGGACVAMINLGYAEMYARGAPIAIATSTVLIGSLILVTLIGLAYKEPITLYKVLGLGFAFVSLFFLMKS